MKDSNKQIYHIGPVKWTASYFFKYLFGLILEVFYKVLFLFPKKQIQKTHYISICAIFKNEGKYLKEWIEYHLLVGVDHFYLYNNNSTDNYLELLQPYIDQGVVTLTEWPEVPGQITAYKHFYEHFRNDTNWVTFLDLDEFICPKKETKIADWLEKWKRYPVICIYWKMFGTSGHLKDDNHSLLIERFTNSWDKLYGRGKLLYNTDYDLVFFKVDMMHYFLVYYKGIKVPPINTYGHFIFAGINRTRNIDHDIQINHYWSKSYENYVNKHKKGSACWGKSWKTFGRFLEVEQRNISSDFVIWRFLVQLKLKMNGEYPEVENDGSDAGHGL